MRGVAPSRIDALPASLEPQFTIIAAGDLEAAIGRASPEGRVALGVILPQGRSYLATLTTPALRRWSPAHSPRPSGGFP